MNRLATLFAGICVSTALLQAGEKASMHCFAFTPIESASTSDWNAFYRATDALPKKIKGLKRVWYGKLAAPLDQVRLSDAAARKQLSAEGKASGEAAVLKREYGVCMEFADEAAFKAYGPDAAHKDWVAVYEKVRIPGTTTFRILGQ